MQLISRKSREQIEPIVAQFEEAWQHGDRPAIDAFLPEDPALREVALVELVHTDLECGLKAGHSIRVEKYLQHYPDLSREDSVVLDLIVAEYTHRRRHSEGVNPSEYLQRFPRYQEQLRQKWPAADIDSEGPQPETVTCRPSPSTDKVPVDRNCETLLPEGPSEAIPAIPERIGRYRIERVLGEGAFGQVYLAQDDELHRPVAIKVPHRRIAKPEDAEAYLAEARVLASLDHPHIVPVYDVGRTEDGLCFVVSKFIEGGDLSRKIKEKRPSFSKSAELVAIIAEALHYAHVRGLVHRDIKPANILIDTTGKPYVADFGLALMEEDFGRGPRFAGTVPYMSPEQARDEGHRVDGGSDIFSLGVVCTNC